MARATAPKNAPPRSTPRRVAAGFFACASPDLDFVFGFLGPAQYLMLHRGPTHSLLIAPLWSLLIAWLLALILREPRGWRALYPTTLMCVVLHIAGDWITGFGTMILWPVSDWRAALGTTFIIDLWFSGIILAGLAASAFLYRSRVPAVVASAVLAGYVGFQYLQKQRALEFGEQYRASRGLTGAEVSAHPRPVSPFNWTVFVSDDQVHRYAHVNLRREERRTYQPGEGFIAKLDSQYLPLREAEWNHHARYGRAGEERFFARSAWGAPGLAFFRWFADLPALEEVTHDPHCAWFVDLRFLTPGRDVMPFQFGACRAGAGWRIYERDGRKGINALD